MKRAMKFFRLMFVGLATVAATLGYADYNTPQAEGAGVIQNLDFANNQLVVSGTQYSVTPSVSVEIAGTYGAFTMLSTGMKIEFTYLHYSDGNKVMQSITEVDEVEEY